MFFTFVVGLESNILKHNYLNTTEKRSVFDQLKIFIEEFSAFWSFLESVYVFLNLCKSKAYPVHYNLLYLNPIPKNNSLLIITT